MLAEESPEGLSTEMISQDLGYEQQAHKTSHCRSEEFSVKMTNGGRWVLMRRVLRKDRGQNTQGSSLTPPHSPLRAMWVHKQRHSSETKICELDMILALQMLGGISLKSCSAQMSRFQDKPQIREGMQVLGDGGDLPLPNDRCHHYWPNSFSDRGEKRCHQAQGFQEKWLDPGPRTGITHFCPQTQLR